MADICVFNRCFYFSKKIFHCSLFVSFNITTKCLLFSLNFSAHFFKHASSLKQAWASLLPDQKVSPWKVFCTVRIKSLSTYIWFYSIAETFRNTKGSLYEIFRYCETKKTFKNLMEIQALSLFEFWISWSPIKNLKSRVWKIFDMLGSQMSNLTLERVNPKPAPLFHCTDSRQTELENQNFSVAAHQKGIKLSVLF